MLDRFGPALEDSLDRPVGVVPHPAGDAALRGDPPDGVPKEDALNPAVDDDPPTNQRAPSA